MLPVHFGPWQTVYWWFRRFVRRLLFRTIHDVALMLDREAAGREASPTGGVLDSQTVKAPFAEVRGFDGGKRIVGRKRHVAVDTDGRLLMVNLTPADVSDSVGAQTILAAIRKRWPWLKHLFADAGYDRTKLMDKAAFLDFVVEIIRRSDKAVGFEVIPRRWVVERTFGWMIRWRRLVRDYEKRLDVSEAMIHVAMPGHQDRPKAEIDGRDRCADRPVHPARVAGPYPLGQRPGIHRQGRAAVDCRGGGRGGVYRARQSLGERLLRELQQQVARRVAERGDLLLAGRGPGRHRRLASSLQHGAPAFVAGIQAARAQQRDLAYSAIRTRYAGYPDRGE
jgi:transposase